MNTPQVAITTRLFRTGVNIGAALPGKHPSEFPPDDGTYEKWLETLDLIIWLDPDVIIPGHGPVMNRADFMDWKTAYDNFVDCGHSDAAKEKCIDGWSQDAAKFIDDAHKAYAREAAEYYLESRLRSSPAEQQKYCKPLTAPKAP